jgi:hypothetical protein
MHPLPENSLCKYFLFTKDSLAEGNSSNSTYSIKAYLFKHNYVCLGSAGVVVAGGSGWHSIGSESRHIGNTRG